MAKKLSYSSGFHLTSLRDELLDEAQPDVVAHVNQLLAEARRAVKLRAMPDSQRPAVELAVPFTDRSYLQALGDEAVQIGLIKAFQITEGHESYFWDEHPVEGAIFVLRTVFPYFPGVAKENSPIYAAHQFFDRSIGGKWKVPAAQERKIKVGPKFEAFLESQWSDLLQTYKEAQVERHDALNAGVWTYGGSGLHLWDGPWASWVVNAEGRMANDAHEKLSLRYFSLEYTAGYRVEDDQNNPHLAIVVPARETVKGLIMPEKTTVYIVGGASRRNIYHAISSGKGIRDADRRILRESRKQLKFEFPYRT